MGVSLRLDVKICPKQLPKTSLFSSISCINSGYSLTIFFRLNVLNGFWMSAMIDLVSFQRHWNMFRSLLLRLHIDEKKSFMLKIAFLLSPSPIVYSTRHGKQISEPKPKMKDLRWNKPSAQRATQNSNTCVLGFSHRLFTLHPQWNKEEKSITYLPEQWLWPKLY